MNKEIQKHLEKSSTLRKTIDSNLEILHYPSYGIPRPPEGSRAASLVETCWLLRRFLIEEMNQPGKSHQESSEVLNLIRKASEVDKRIYEAGSDNPRAQVLEKEAFRPLVMEVRDFSSRSYAMLGQPIWPVGHVPVDTNAVFYSGSDGLRGIVTGICRQLGLSVMQTPYGESLAASRWKQLRKAMIAVFDLGFEDGSVRASVAYELGICLALGKPIIILDSIDYPVPFDVHIEPVTHTGDKIDEQILATAIDRSIAWTYDRTSSENILLTLDHIQSKYSRSFQDIYLDQTFKLLIGQKNEPDPLEFNRILEKFVDFLNDGSTMLIHPVWSPGYPKADHSRLFHVTPYRPKWADDVMAIIKEACRITGVDYVRGDEMRDPNVIRSIWEEIGQATHILVDLTGFSANVALELGIAHTIGRPCLLVGQGDTLKHLFPMIKKFRFDTYKDLAELQAVVSDFLKGQS